MIRSDKFNLSCKTLQKFKRKVFRLSEIISLKFISNDIKKVQRKRQKLKTYSSGTKLHTGQQQA